MCSAAISIDNGVIAAYLIGGSLEQFDSLAGCRIAVISIAYIGGFLHNRTDGVALVANATIEHALVRVVASVSSVAAFGYGDLCACVCPANGFGAHAAVGIWASDVGTAVAITGDTIAADLARLLGFVAASAIDT